MPHKVSLAPTVCVLVEPLVEGLEGVGAGLVDVF